MTERPFDPDRAFRLLARLSIPRAVGTAGEKLAARLVERAFIRSGRSVVRERFPVGRTARRFGTLFALLGTLALITIATIGVPQWPVASVFCVLLAILLVNAPWIVTRSLADRVRSGVWSENLVSWPVEEADWGAEGAPARVVFLAHYDSKSQRLPTGVRVALVVAVTIGCVVLALLSGVAWLAPGWIGFGANLAVSSVVVFCLIALMFNASGNRSPGALDNASGMAVLLELARCWQPRSGEPLDVAFLATGSEEVGLDGARAFLQRHEWWLRERPTLLINLESVGAGNRVWLSGNAVAVSMAEQIASRFAVPTGRFRVLGAGMDHEPFAAAGLFALSLLGDVVGTSASLHSPRDGLHLIDRDALSRASLLASHLAWSWAEQHQPSASESISEPAEAVLPGLPLG